MSIAVPTSNVLLRTLWFGRQDRNKVIPSGSGFAATVGDEEYVVTARHVAHLCRFQPYLRYNNQWNKDTWSVLVDNEDADIAVLKCENTKIINSPLSVQYGVADGTTHGQVGYALGYPTVFVNGIQSTGHVLEMHGRPIPIPTMLLLNMPSGNDVVYSASYVNDGYSGGAVVYNIPKTDDWCVSGIITHFPTVLRSVLDATGRNTKGYVQQHTGLVGFRPWTLIGHLIETARKGGAS